MQRGITGNDQHPADWERQRERLSAYLDGELVPAERAALSTHLATCPACRAELNDLRALRAMLRAMPAPALPRSFLLPDAGAVPQPLSVRRTVSPVTTRPRPRGPRIAEWAGALVASLGLALLLGSAFVGHGASTTSLATSPNNGEVAQTNAGSPSPTTPTYSGHTPQLGPGEATSTANASETAQPTRVATPTPSSTATTQRGNNTPTTVESVPPALPIGGAGLFIGGAVVFVVGRASAKRRPAA